MAEKSQISNLKSASSRHHILIIIPGMAGGTGTFCRSLASGLRGLFGGEFKVSLLTFRPDAKQPENAIHFDQTHVLSSELHNDWRRLLDLGRTFFRLRNAVYEINPDLIFTIGTFSNVVTSLAVDHIPIAMSDHLNMTHRLSEYRLGVVTAWFMRRTYREHLMIAASKELADDLRENFGVQRTRVIPNGIDASVVRRRADEPAPPIAASRYFMWIGRLTLQKDVATLLRAFAIARSRGLDHDLVIAGDGEQKEMLHKLARELNLTGHAHFLGLVPNPYSLLKRARALVLSSIWEGFAYAPIEAMGLGVPVISTACPSGPVEILGGGEFGILVPISNPGQLADAMIRLAGDETLHRQFVAKSLIRADQLSVENMTRQYREAFLREIAGH